MHAKYKKHLIFFYRANSLLGADLQQTRVQRAVLTVQVSAVTASARPVPRHDSLLFRYGARGACKHTHTQFMGRFERILVDLCTP